MNRIKKIPYEMDLTSGNLFKKLFAFSLPIMFSSFLQLLYNATDLIVCGQFGSEHSVAAISSTGSLVNLIVQLFMGLSIGVNVVMSYCVGSGNREKANRVVHTAILISIMGGIIVGTIGAVFSKDFLILMKAPSDVLDLSTDYIRIFFYGLPALMIYNYGAAILRASGDTKRPFYFLTISGVINVILNLILVIFFKLDVKGVAIATVTSEVISACLIIMCLRRKLDYGHLALKKLKIYKTETLEIIKIGLPAGLQGSIFSLSNVLIQSSVNSLGTVVMDGNGAASSIGNFVYSFLSAIAQAMVSFVSVNLGAKKKENIKKSIINAIVIVVFCGMILGALTIIFGKFLLKIYVKNEVAIATGYERLVIMCSTYFTCGIMDIFANSLRGLKHSLLPAIISLCGACGSRILWIYLVFPIPSFHNMTWLMLSYPISWIITALVHGICLLFIYKKETKKLLIE